MEMMLAVRELLDRQAIEQLAIQHCRSVDSRCAEEQHAIVDAIMTDDVSVTLPYGAWNGKEAHKRSLTSGPTQIFTFTHHILSNPIITIDGDEAEGRYVITGMHGVMIESTERKFLAGGIYTQNSVRLPEGWKIRRHVLSSVWMDTGDIDLEPLLVKASALTDPLAAA